MLGLVFACLSLACSAAPEAALPTDSAEPAADAATPVEDAPSTTAPTEVSPGPTDEVTDDDAGADTATDRRDPPQSDPDAGRPPADGAIGEPLAVDLTGVPQAPGRLFRVVPADKYHGPPISSSMAIADFNGDGRQDIFVPGQPAAILYNRGDLGFEVYVPDLDWPSFMLSASAMDLDLDGRTDIVLGARGYLQVAFQRADGWELGPAAPTIAGTATPGFTFVPDYDGDGRPDAVVVAQYGWPPGLPGFLTGLEGVEDHESFAGNTLMYIGQGGAMTSLPLSEYAPPAVAECASKMSWTALFLPRHRWGLGGVVWTGNECTDDCWTPYEPNARLLTELLPGDHIGARNGTMGGDYILDGDDILVASSDFAGRDPSIWKLPLTGPVEFVGERLVRTHFDGYDLTWGIVFENSYLLAASGPRVFDDPAWQARFDSAPGSFAKLTSPGRINIFAHDPVTGDYVENHDLLPPQIEGSGWFHIASGDFFGADGFGDGCPDAIVTPMYHMPAPADLARLAGEDWLDVMSFMGVNTMLLNTCILDGEGQFVGVDLPSRGWAVGAIAELTTASGAKVTRSSRTTSGVGGARDPRVILPASADDPPVSVHIYYASGAEEEIEAPAMGVYHPVTGPGP